MYIGNFAACLHDRLVFFQKDSAKTSSRISVKKVTKMLRLKCLAASLLFLMLVFMFIIARRIRLMITDDDTKAIRKSILSSIHHGKQSIIIDQLNEVYLDQSIGQLNLVDQQNRSSDSKSEDSTPHVPRLQPQQSNAKTDQACRFPNLALDAPSIRHLFEDPKPLECSTVDKNWVFIKNGTFFIDRDAIERHGNIECRAQSFWRVTDAQVESEAYENFKSGSKLKTDFLKVQCRAADNSSYENVHATVIPSDMVLNRARNTQSPQDALGLNVYMLGFDSVSRLQFIRKLPKLYKYLTETMDAVVLEGYNIVGDGTPQALIPILTGKTELELPLTRKRFPNANYVNVYPFVWNEYRDAGYATLYGEDASYIGTFTYRLKGFKDQPTDHYMRTFYSIAEPETKKHKDNCWGSEEHHKVHFDYVEDFWNAYQMAIRKFAFSFHAYFSHDDLNLIGVADDHMVKHMQYFVDNGHMNNSIVIFMSDHGPRFATLRETQQGKFEERLPFFSFAFPPWFKTRYPEIMQAFRKNAHRLTTPFDIHATLKNILHFDPKLKKGNLKSRSISLFDEIPPERTCADAGIEVHWCTCLDWKDVPIDDPTVQVIAREFVEKMNNETAYERNLCAELKLQKIDKASKYTPASAVLNYKKAKDLDGFEADLSAKSDVEIEYYQVDFWTTPGNAHYEASASWDRRRKELNIDLNLVSHVNKYGDLPNCVIDKDYFLAKWCVCYDKI